MSKFHQSVLTKEVLSSLTVVPGEVYLDCTLGGGGHTKGILDFGASVIALDVDHDAIANAEKEFGLVERGGVWVTKDERLKIYKKNFVDLDIVARHAGVTKFSGILFDLGVSSFMLDRPEKGFSFSKIGNLDMRMDQTLAVTAADLVNGLNEGELYELFSRLGEEFDARSVSRAIVRSRVNKKIETTRELASIVAASKKVNAKVDPATKVFMALRIAVNDELNNLKTALPKTIDFLKIGGRLVVISFHSLEDRIVKDFNKSRDDLRVLTPKPITAQEVELAINPRARSAKMRVAERI